MAFITLRGVNAVSVMDVPRGTELLRFDTGSAPIATLVLDDNRLLVHNYLGRSVSVFDMTSVFNWDLEEPTVVATVNLVTNETLDATILKGKLLFHIADAQMTANAYISCATVTMPAIATVVCGTLRTVAKAYVTPPIYVVELARRTATCTGPRTLMKFKILKMISVTTLVALSDDDDFNATRDTLGAAKAGLSDDIDSIAAYVGSLDTFPASPHRDDDGNMTANALAGEIIFKRMNCATCHSGTNYTDSSLGVATLHNVGTLKDSSGQRLNENLQGIDTPTLRGVWSSAPYFHDVGSYLARCYYAKWARSWQHVFIKC